MVRMCHEICSYFLLFPEHELQRRTCFIRTRREIQGRMEWKAHEEHRVGRIICPPATADWGSPHLNRMFPAVKCFVRQQDLSRNHVNRSFDALNVCIKVLSSTTESARHAIQRNTTDKVIDTHTQYQSLYRLLVLCSSKHDEIFCTSASYSVLTMRARQQKLCRRTYYGV